MEIFSAAIDGMNLTLTHVEADVAQGLPAFTVVGLGDASIKEARERIRPAIKKSGFSYPLRRMVVNLSPAHVKKQGSHFDLPIALSILQSSGQIAFSKFKRIFCIGELTLDGHIRSVPGVLALVQFAKKRGFQNIIVPFDSYSEAAIIDDINIYPAKNIQEVLKMIGGENFYKPTVKKSEKKKFKGIDISDILGHQSQKRALEIAVAGRHHIAMIGPPGTGKSMLAKSLPGIMPKLDKQESMEVSMIYSLANKVDSKSFPIEFRPFRHVHHTTSSITIIGGGNPVKFGQATLAHKGILFLDEFSEFSSNQLECLREPLQEGLVRLGLHGKMRLFPADFQLIAAMNPCACGYYGDEVKSCSCTPYQIKLFYKKLSGPIVDRIDMIIEVPRIKNKNLSSANQNERSHVVRKRVEKAWLIQQKRGLKNSQIQFKDIDRKIFMVDEAKRFLSLINEKMDLSARSYLSIIRVARTIADLDESLEIQKKHVAEAVQYKKQLV